VWPKTDKISQTTKKTRFFKDNNDGIELYCAKNLFPCLGDHKYSNLVRTIRNQPFLADPNTFENKPQQLHPNLSSRLGLNSFMNVRVPMHLHLTEIHMPKTYKKQKIVATIKSPLPDYFSKTLNFLNLSFSKINTEIKAIENKAD
jgi:hypothetical protein